MRLLIEQHDVMSGFVGDALFFTRVRALEVFYEQHSPELFDSAGSVLATFHGLESELFEHLRDQHSDEGLALHTRLHF